uniref:Uncharacterized protein n=1 Tax=Arundo donax TaxID=35708 RepID=A0A0A9QHE8_ARUDO
MPLLIISSRSKVWSCFHKYASETRPSLEQTLSTRSLW